MVQIGSYAMTTKHLTQPPQPSLFISVLAWLLNTALDFAQWATFHGERLLTKYRVLEVAEDFVMHSSHHPVVAVVLGVAAVVCGVPIFVFACFAIISSLITFTGFLFIEGTLLTVAFGLLLCFLLVFGSILIGLFTAGAATYLGLQRLRRVLNSVLQISQPPVQEFKVSPSSSAYRSSSAISISRPPSESVHIQSPVPGCQSD